ncbi:MAG: hypothetical protein JHC84_09630 [Solirubrobacteraceae bacterium]|nr:hypothetical protein [Solirubrobacteraceae bacterium]
MAALGGERMMVMAHLGTDHWWASLLYLLPVLIVVAGIGITSWRDKRHEGEDDDAPTTPPGPTPAP